MKNTLLIISLITLLTLDARAIDSVMVGNDRAILQTNLNLVGETTFTNKFTGKTVVVSNGTVRATSMSATTFSGALSGSVASATGYPSSALVGNLAPTQLPDAITTNDTRTVNLASVNTSNILVGGALVFSSTTNAVHATGAGDANAIGNFQTNGLAGTLTNLLTHETIQNIANVYYFVTTNGVLQYSNPNLFGTNWLRINGPFPVPSTLPGVAADFSGVAVLASTLGLQLFGFIPMTGDQITNSLQSLAANANDYATNAAVNIIIKSNLVSSGQSTTIASNLIDSQSVIALNGFVVVQSGPTNQWVFTNLDRALAQFVQPVDKSTPGGGKISIGSGTFPFTSRYLLTNNNVGGWEIAGAGSSSTILRYDGTQVGSIFTVAGNPTNDANLAYYFHDFSIFSSTNMLAACFTVQNTSEGIFERVAMGSWRAEVDNGLDNSVTGHGRGYLGIQHGLLNPAAEKPGLLGIVDLGSQGNKLKIADCEFINCADGIYFTTDHGYVGGNVFQACGSWLSNTITIKGDTAWPNTSKYSLGADLILDQSAFAPSLADIHIIFNSHYRARAGIVSFIGSSGLFRYPVAQYEYFENCDYSGVTFGAGNLTLLNNTESGAATPSPASISGPPYSYGLSTRVMETGFDSASIDSDTVFYVTSSGGGVQIHRSTGIINAGGFEGNSWVADNMENNGNGYVAVDNDGNLTFTTDGENLTNITPATAFQFGSKIPNNNLSGSVTLFTTNVVTGISNASPTRLLTFLRTNSDGSGVTLVVSNMAPYRAPLLSELPVLPFGNLRLGLSAPGAVYVPITTAYTTLTNFNEFASNNFTGDPGQGTMTNTVAGNYMETVTVTVLSTDDSNPIYQEAFFTNGVLAGVEIEYNTAAQLNGNLDFVFPDAGQEFFLPAGTRCEWKVKQVGSPEQYTFRSATAKIQYKP